MSKEKKQFYSSPMRLLPSKSRVIPFKLDGQYLPELKPEIREVNEYLASLNDTHLLGPVMKEPEIH